MDYLEEIKSMRYETYGALKQGIELGKWPNGRPLTEAQKAISMKAVLHYEILHQIPETERVGYIAPKPAQAASCRKPPVSVQPPSQAD